MCSIGVRPLTVAHARNTLPRETCGSAARLESVELTPLVCNRQEQMSDRCVGRNIGQSNHMDNSRWLPTHGVRLRRRRRLGLLFLTSLPNAGGNLLRAACSD